MFKHLSELSTLNEAKLKAFKIQVPQNCNVTEDAIFGEDEGDKSFIQNQTIVTVEYVDLKGKTLYVYPMMDTDPDMSEATQKRLQKAFDTWCAGLKEGLITEEKKQFKVSWKGYPGNPKPEIVTIDWFDGMGFDDDMDDINALGVGEEHSSYGPFDSVTVERLKDLKEEEMAEFKLSRLAQLAEGQINEVQVRLKPATRIKALDHFGSETENPGGYKDIRNGMKFLGIDSLVKDKLHSIDSDGNAADFKKHARNLGFKELEYPDNNDAKVAGFERVGVKNGTTFWKKGNALLLLTKDAPPTFMIKEGQEQLAEGAGPLSRPIENWQEANKAYRTEGPQGVRNFAKLAKAIGYSSIEDFLEDNSGCIEAMVDWIGRQNVPEWKEGLIVRE